MELAGHCLSVPQSFSEAVCLYWTRSVAVSALSLSVWRCAVWLLSVPIRPYWRASGLTAPRRLGLGTPGSCEAAKHSTVRFLESFVPDHVVRKLDFSYAFNSIHRRDMLQAVFERIPELFAFASSAYSVTSIYCFTPLSGCFHKRALSKATHWARFCFATRFSRYFYLWLTN